MFRARERKRNIIGTRRTCDTRKIYDVSFFFLYIFFFFFVPFLFFSFSLFSVYTKLEWKLTKSSTFFLDIQSLDKLKVCASIYIYICGGREYCSMEFELFFNIEFSREI